MLSHPDQIPGLPGLETLKKEREECKKKVNREKKRVWPGWDDQDDQDWWCRPREMRDVDPWWWPFSGDPFGGVCLYEQPVWDVGRHLSQSCRRIEPATSFSDGVGDEIMLRPGRGRTRECKKVDRWWADTKWIRGEVSRQPGIAWDYQVRIGDKMIPRRIPRRIGIPGWGIREKRAHDRSLASRRVNLFPWYLSVF